MRTRFSSPVASTIAGLIGCMAGLSAGTNTSWLHSTFEQQTMDGQIRFHWHGGTAGIILDRGGNIQIGSKHAGPAPVTMRFQGANTSCNPRGEAPELVQVRY